MNKDKFCVWIYHLFNFSYLLSCIVTLIEIFLMMLAMSGEMNEHSISCIMSIMQILLVCGVLSLVFMLASIDLYTEGERIVERESSDAEAKLAMLRRESRMLEAERKKKEQEINELVIKQRGEEE